MNEITKETYNAWYENIEWLCRNFQSDSEKAAEEILNYLEAEGAFEVIDRDKS